MGKEAKIGVAVILGLLVVLGIVVGVRVASLGGDDTPLDPDGQADATTEESPVSVEQGVAVSASLPRKPSEPASKPNPSSPSKKPDEPPKPSLVTPDHPESPDSPAAQWRRLAVADAESGTAGVVEVSEGGSTMPPPPDPSPQTPNPRYGSLYSHPDSTAGYASADGVSNNVRSYDPSQSGRFDTSRQGVPYGYASAGGSMPPAGQPIAADRSDARMRSAPIMPSSDGRGLAYPSADDGRRSDGTYEVQPNDSFWTISEKLYGTGAYFQALAELNGDKAPSRNQLQVGQRIAAPDVAELEQKYPALCPKPEHRYVARQQAVIRPVGQYGDAPTYTVMEGDSLYRIARYELGDASRWHEIYKLNREVIGESFNHLRPGTQLVLPNTVSSEDPQPADTLTRRPSSLY